MLMILIIAFIAAVIYGLTKRQDNSQVRKRVLDSENPVIFKKKRQGSPDAL